MEEGRQRGRDPVLKREVAEHVDALDGLGGVVELVDNLKDAVPGRAEGCTKSPQLVVIREPAGHRLEVVVDVDIARRHPAGTGIQALFQRHLHGGHLVGGGRAMKGVLAHHPHPQGTVPHQRGQVDPDLALQGAQPSGEGLPLPVDSLFEGRHRQVLDLTEHPAEPVPLAGVERGDGERAIARHDGRHAVFELRLGQTVPAHLGVEVGVDVDEAGGDGVAAGVELHAALLGNPAHSDDAPAFYTDLPEEGRHPGAVVDEGVPHNEIEHGDSRVV